MLYLFHHPFNVSIAGMANNFSEKAQFEAEDISPLAAEGQNLCIDDDTIYSTPNPVAASTVGRPGRDRNLRYE